ncbi:MAG TPA: hypothetical protein VKG65_00880 [Terriglobales bacterium]|nr:hypothetical protein [Terriglobales bacterium]
MPNYFAYSPEQAELLPRHVGDELPPGHLCFLIHEMIEGLELSRFDEAYPEEGQKAYNPRLMLKLWLYGFGVNVRSTRIKANASPDRLRQQDERQVRQWRREMETEDPDQEPGLEVGAETVERLRREMGRATGAAAPSKQSLTDPDARFLRERGGRFGLGYCGPRFAGRQADASTRAGSRGIAAELGTGNRCFPSTQSRGVRA